MFSLGGQACLDPADLAKACDDQDPPLPVDDWLGKANRFSVPRGAEPGTGLIILSRKALNSLEINDYLTLIIDDLDGHKLEMAKIVVSGAPRCVTPGLRGDETSTYAVPIADRRFLLQRLPIDKGYNVRPPGGGDYLTETTDSGTPWTWATMVADLETALGITIGALPFTPAGTPEGLQFFSGSAWAALNKVLDLCGCTLVYDPVDDDFAIVEVGATDGGLTAALEDEDRIRDWDADTIVPTFSRVPDHVRVRFQRVPAPDDGSSPWYYIEKDYPGSVTTSVFADAIVWLEGGMEAQGGTGTPSNDTDLQTRATEVANKWYQALLTGTDPLLRRYIGVRTNPGLRPGKRVHAVVWQDLGDGHFTEVYRGPPAPLPPLADLPTTSTPNGNAAIVRLFANDQQDPSNLGANYVTDPDTGILYWLGTTESFTQDGGETDDSPPDPYIFIVPYYQPLISGTSRLPPAGYAFVGIDMRTTATLTVDPLDGPLDGNGNPTANPGEGTSEPREMTLAVWQTAFMFAGMVCDPEGDDQPVISYPA